MKQTPNDDDPREAELMAQLVRVAPALASGKGLAFEFVGGVERALQVVRSLPDGAGLDALLRALGYSDDQARELKDELDA
jgi:hypothetical protein